MIRKLTAAIGFVALAAAAALPAQAGTIAYEVAADPSAVHAYVTTYHLNGGFDDGSAFNLLFDAGRYTNVSLDWSSLSGIQPGWLALDGAIEPQPALPADGLLQLLATTPIQEHDGTFRVAFDWIGAGLPGAQSFELIDQAGNLAFSGTTTAYVAPGPNPVPEPAPALLLAGGAVLLLRQVRRRPRA
jgi:hypothetical protein